jgi:KDO2-lipid IV(A) lauroyltransferase
MRAPLHTLRYDLGYWCLRRVLAISPRPGLRFWQKKGQRLGALLWLVAVGERRRTLSHLRLAFPEASEAWRRTVARGCARHLGSLLGEVVWLWGVPAEELLACTEFHGLQHLDQCVGEYGGAIIGTGHCGNWEWLNLALAARGTPLTVAVRGLDDRRFDSLVRSLRSRFGGKSISRGEGAGRALFAAGRRGNILGLLIDQDIEAPGCFVEFFGRPAWTPTGAGVLAHRLQRPIIPAFAVRQRGGKMLLCFDEPMHPGLSNDPETDARLLTACLTARIEEQIRAYPEQWVWMHRRWRRQPRTGEEVLWRSATMSAHRPC